MNVVVAVPYRPDFGHRDRLFTHLREHFWNNVGFRLLIGRNDDDPFNRSAAVNTALAGSWDVAVIADADTWVPARRLHEAVDLAWESDRLVAAFDAVVELSREGTEDVLCGRVGLGGSFSADRVRTRELETQSSMLAVSRFLWNSVGGFDERFRGWGAEDNAFWRACAIRGGEPERLAGNAYHLWHPAAAGKHGGIQYKANVNLWRRYERAQSVDDLAAI